MGRLVEPKAHWNLLRVYKGVKENIKNLKLVILGDDILKDKLVEFSKNLGLKTYSVWGDQDKNEDYGVYFLGFQKNPFSMIANSSIFVSTSLWEGFHNALLEGMVCGLPVISSDCKSGPREILNPGTKVKVDMDEAEFGQYGILLPVMHRRIKEAKGPFTEREKLWIKTITDVLNDDQAMESYSKLSQTRASDFESNKSLPEWRAALDKVKKINK